MRVVVPIAPRSRWIRANIGLVDSSWRPWMGFGSCNGRSRVDKSFCESKFEPAPVGRPYGCIYTSKAASSPLIYAKRDRKESPQEEGYRHRNTTVSDAAAQKKKTTHAVSVAFFLARCTAPNAYPFYYALGNRTMMATMSRTTYHKIQNTAISEEFIETFDFLLPRADGCLG